MNGQTIQIGIVIPDLTSIKPTDFVLASFKPEPSSVAGPETERAGQSPRGGKEMMRASSTAIPLISGLWVRHWRNFLDTFHRPNQSEENLFVSLWSLQSA